MASTVSAQDIETETKSALASLEAGFSPGEVEDFQAALSGGMAGDALGHLLYMRRHFDKAAWFFGQDLVGDPGDAASLNNFAATLTETALATEGLDRAALIGAARAASEAAVAIAGNTAAFYNTLANAARAGGDWDAAVAAARRATELAPEESLYWTNLARALDGAGDHEAAAEALLQAHAIAPNSTEVLATSAALPDAGPAYSGGLQRSCNVNFRCQEICPRSIIGGLQSVSCEIENSSAQMACQAGQPYATSYDCSEDLPDYGILIPGLNAGFSISGPGFSIHVTVDGDGTTHVRGELGLGSGPLGGYVRGDGHFSPSNGASFDNLGGGVRVNVLPGGSAAGDLAGTLGHPPAHIEAESLNGNPPDINVETYGAGLISF